jgi:malonate-semialdehyde dehydrogenase (acetylating)/methylmalonate-semialdehyde dehydrogenase
MTETISHWIDGKRQDGYSGRTGPVFDPATGRERARVAFASVEEVRWPEPEHRGVDLGFPRSR